MMAFLLRLQVAFLVACIALQTSAANPEPSPNPNKDGSCATYTVGKGNICAQIAKDHSTTAAKIESFNRRTWGWMGCNDLQLGMVICISSGTPPMPASLDNAVCGPQVKGTKAPAPGVDLASLNPCPLNACCDIWGQCGITDEFCTETKSPTGAPGTAARDTNGCISNCGAKIVNNGVGPKSFMKVGYFEAFNVQRRCLTMDVTQIDTTKFSHVHFAFAEITSDYQVDISQVQDQFDKFVTMSGIKRILSFGGWSFSTDQDSYPIFRNGVTDANRKKFAASVVDFVKHHDIDGVDFDWEYPGAPDIPGIPKGSPSDGRNYLQFLQDVRAGLPSGKTLSIAALASYWYLKGFPIKDMAPVLDYIIYMTYDLHGQWDYGHQYSDPGCPSGACLPCRPRGVSPYHYNTVELR